MALRKTIGYIKARLTEKSTWMGIGIAITGGAALSVPYSWLFIATGVLAALFPTSSSDKGEGCP